MHISYFLFFLSFLKIIYSGILSRNELKVKSSDSEQGNDFEEFGFSVSISGDFAIIGDHQKSSTGAAYIFEKTESSWVETQILLNENQDYDQNFGCSVSISRNYAIVGAKGDSDNGSITFFERNETNYWERKQKFFGSKENEKFGYSVFISRNYAIVGTLEGESASIFHRNESTNFWEEQTKLFVNKSETNNSFSSVSLFREDYSILGAPGTNYDKGKAYVYQRTGTNWELKQTFNPEDIAGVDTQESFGSSVLISNDFYIIGANNQKGAVYFFYKNFSLHTKLSPCEGNNSLFGSSISVDKNIAIIGAYGNSIPGKVFVYLLNGTTWELKDEINSNSTDSDFGISVSLSNHYAIMGAPFFKEEGKNFSSGAAYFYEIGFSCNGSTFGCGNDDQGYCSNTDLCKCNDGWDSNEPINCLIFDCKDSCNNHGICLGPNNCSCNEGFLGDFCSYTHCNDIRSDDSTVCNSTGNCTGYDVCECSPGWFEEFFCEEWGCFGILPTDNQSCSSHGDCISPNECNCSEGYSGDECEEWDCYEISRTNKDVCGGHGECVSLDSCNCDESYLQTKDCKGWDCYNKSHSSGEACSQNGLCLDYNKCYCLDGYSGKECEDWNCSRIAYDDEEVCSRKGICFKPNTCLCNDGYEGNNCDIFKCGVYYSNDSLVCSENGICLSPSNCSCFSGFSGDTCNINSGLIIGITVSASTVAVIFILFLLILSIIIGFLIFFSKKQKKRLNRFEKIDGIDIIAEENELESKEGVSFKINKKLFKIDFEKIEFKKKIGQGGSSAVVYLCKYEDRDLVFKCFSMNEFDDERKYQEFEKEVEVIGSVSHENILRFFGASVKPPRVGYLMQYCENGDVKHFLSKRYKNTTGKEYSTFGRINMLLQISSAMNHLHSLFIIHRDLKCENVLIDSAFNCQVMDFGLSKIYSLGKMMTMKIGTSQYMSPEMVLSETYSLKVDVFSFSIMIFEIMTGNFNPYGKVSFNIERKVAQDESFRPNFKDYKNIPLFIQDLAKKGWNHDPQLRPSFKEIKEEMKRKLNSKRNVKIFLKEFNSKIKKDFILKESTFDCLKSLVEDKFLSGNGFKRIIDSNERVIEERNIFDVIKEGIELEVILKEDSEKDLIKSLQKIITKKEKIIKEKERIIEEKDRVIEEKNRIIKENNFVE